MDRRGSGKHSRQAKDREHRKKPRVRLRLLLLLWVWAILMFAVVDLFYNVPEFDQVRPRAELYRAMRYAAHEMVERPYTENDDFGRVSRPQGMLSDSQALAEVREQVLVSANDDTRDPYLAVSVATLGRVDMREVEPPPQFKGTDLEWRLHGRMDSEELAALLRSLRDLGPRDRRAVLHRVFRQPDPRVASALVEAKKGLDGPPLLLMYCAASRSMIHVLGAESGGESGSGQRSLGGVRGDLVATTLEALVRMVTRFRPYLDESQWGGIRGALEQLYRDAPGFDVMQRYRALTDQIRSATMRTLVEAARPGPNYMGGLEVIKVAVLLRDQATCDVLLDLLDARTIFIQKIASAESRTDIAFLEIACGAIIAGGEERHWARLAMTIADGLASQDIDSQTRETFVRLGRSLQKRLAKGFDGRATAALKLAVDAAEGRNK